MATASKIICDRCGDKSSEDQHFNPVGWYIMYKRSRRSTQPAVCDPHFDLCPGCENAFEFWMRVGKKS